MHPIKRETASSSLSEMKNIYFFSRRLIKDSTIVLSKTLNVFNITRPKSLSLIKQATIGVHIIYHIGIKEIVCKMVPFYKEFITWGLLFVF